MTEAAKYPKIVTRVLLVLAAVLSIMTASAMTNAPGLMGANDADAAVAYRQIKGTVLRSDSGQAVPNAKVSLEQYNAGSGRWKVIRTGQANSIGQFHFYNVSTDFYYRIRAEKSIGGGVYHGLGNYFFLGSSFSTVATSNVTLNMPRPF